MIELYSIDEYPRQLPGSIGSYVNSPSMIWINFWKILCDFGGFGKAAMQGTKYFFFKNPPQDILNSSELNKHPFFINILNYTGGFALSLNGSIVFLQL